LGSNHDRSSREVEPSALGFLPGVPLASKEAHKSRKDGSKMGAPCCRRNNQDTNEHLAAGIPVMNYRLPPCCRSAAREWRAGRHLEPAGCRGLDPRRSATREQDAGRELESPRGHAHPGYTGAPTRPRPSTGVPTPKSRGTRRPTTALTIGV
jgi:hypothetical protein